MTTPSATSRLSGICALVTRLFKYSDLITL